MLQHKRVPLLHVDDVNSKDFVRIAEKIAPDIILSAAYPQIFAAELIQIPRLGFVNFHPSLLPKFRGAHPHYWAIVQGERVSGLTAHFVTEHVDEGDIIAQIEYPIGDYTYQELYDKMIAETPTIIKKVVFFFASGKTKWDGIRQDSSAATVFRNDRRIHHRIFWEQQTAEQINNLVRGGEAFCFFRDKKIILAECVLTNGNKNLTNNIRVPGGIIVDITRESIAVSANGGVVNIKRLIYKGRQMHAWEYAVRQMVQTGEQLH